MVTVIQLLSKFLSLIHSVYLTPKIFSKTVSSNNHGQIRKKEDIRIHSMFHLMQPHHTFPQLSTQMKTYFTIAKVT